MNSLKAQLSLAMAPNRVFGNQVWGSPKSMTDVLRDIQRSVGDKDGGRPSEDVLYRALRSFATTRQVANFNELKYLCYGAAVPTGSDKSRLMDRPTLFTRLLELVDKIKGQLKQFRRCFQALADSFFSFDRYGNSALSGVESWEKLRRFLGMRLAPLLEAVQQRGSVPVWLKALSEHKNLLEEDPCARYARDFQIGKMDSFQQMSEALGISRNSWVWCEAYLAHIRNVCALQDTAFKSQLTRSLGIIAAPPSSDFVLPQLVATQASALLVRRYEACPDRLENDQLRDVCLKTIGNPWLDPQAWAAYVDHEPTRLMVEGWLKRRLIKDFFELLTHDGAADVRRLEYWLKWEPRISDMWFVLGDQAQQNRTQAFKDLKERMAGRARILADTTRENNAFVMRIGPLIVVEFGQIGNACYVYDANLIRFNLEDRVHSIHRLKVRSLGDAMTHSGSWEPKFDEALAKHLRRPPRDKAALKTVS